MAACVPRSHSFARAAIAVWFGAMLLLGAALLAKHVVALPAPAKDQKLAASLTAFRPPHRHGWLAVHVLYSECRCSRLVVAHLVSTARPIGWDEVVLWVGAGAPDPALEQSFRVAKISNAGLARLGIDAAPLLVVLDPRDQLRYAGGYSERKQGPVLDDLHIFDEAQHAATIASLPIFGCAVSERLQRQLSILPGL